MEFNLIIHNMMLFSFIYCLKNHFNFVSKLDQFFIKVYPFLLYGISVMFAFHPILTLHKLFAIIPLFMQVFIYIFTIPKDEDYEKEDINLIFIYFIPITLLTFLLFNTSLILGE